MNSNDYMTISAKRGWFNIDFKELWRYRDLMLLLARRDFIAVYKQTILGPFWFLLQPLATALVFTIVFSIIAGIPTAGLPPVLFYLSGVVLWSFFSTNLSKISETLYANAGLFGKVYFPRLAVPCASLLVNSATFAIQFCVLLCVSIFFDMRGIPLSPFWALLGLPLLMIQMAALAVGVGLLVAALTTRYRDLTFFLGFAIQLWMFATPIIYPASQVPSHWQWLLIINPMSSVIGNFRALLTGSPFIEASLVFTSLIMTGLFFLAGLMAFSRVEKTFVDRI